MPKMINGVQKSWDKLEPDQLKLYAKELAELHINEQRILLELEEKNVVLEHRIRDLETLLEIDKVLVRALNETELARSICRIIVDIEGYQLAVVRFVLTKDEENAQLIGPKKHEVRYPDSDDIRWADAQYIHAPTTVTINTGKPYVVQNVLIDPSASLWSDEVSRNGYGSLISIPLVADNETYGALAVYTLESDAFDNEKVKLLTQVAGDLSFGIINLRSRVERNRLEKKMVEYEELDKLKTNLLSTVSHELRTPLATIKGYGTLLLDYDRRLKRDEKLEYLTSMVSATDRLTELVDHLLDMSRLEAGLLKLQKRPSSISKLVREAIAEARLRAKTHNIIWDKKGRLPKVNIDGRRIRQVLDNILDNATKYSGERTTVIVKTRVHGSEIHISTSDQGIGIPAEDLKRVFNRMYRVEQRLTAGIRGAGLGLAICKGLVEAHGGRIWVESEQSKGSDFHFTLPVLTVNQVNDNAWKT
ncbi:MAG: response regulator [Dehalococcoidia bacterium]|nr:response regulator [Dehalococcoidia bacterium]